MSTTITIVAVVTALLIVGGFIWWQLEKNVGAQQVIASQQDELGRQHDKLAAEQAIRIENVKKDQEVMYADAQRIADISDVEERRKAALEAVKKAIERRTAASIYPAVKS